MDELDIARIRQTVLAVPTLVDIRLLDVIPALFAPRVRVDYTSLWGGSPQDMSPTELVAGWRSLVPGFDATWHEISDIQCSIDGDRASVRCQVSANHWLGGELWRPRGVYEYDLVRSSDRWRISLMRFVLAEEIGRRSLTDEARARLKT
jgi:hypothetical protein